jgi:hypothetical protein
MNDPLEGEVWIFNGDSGTTEYKILGLRADEGMVELENVESGQTFENYSLNWFTGKESLWTKKKEFKLEVGQIWGWQREDEHLQKTYIVLETELSFDPRQCKLRNLDKGIEFHYSKSGFTEFKDQWTLISEPEPEAYLETSEPSIEVIEI